MIHIYEIINTINNKRYVGKTKFPIEKRFKTHIKNAKKKINRYLYDSMNKYGYENFVIKLIETVEDELGSDSEIKHIQELNSLMPNGYNMTIGGDGGYTILNWSDEDKAELYKRQALKRSLIIKTEEQQIALSENISSGLLEFHANLSEEDKAKKLDRHKRQSTTRKNKIKSGELKIVLPPSKYGKDHHGYIAIDVELVKIMIKCRWKLVDIAKELGVRKNIILSRLKEECGKTFTELRKEYGITGSFGSVKRIEIV